MNEHIPINPALGGLAYKAPETLKKVVFVGAQNYERRVVMRRILSWAGVGGAALRKWAGGGSFLASLLTKPVTDFMQIRY